MTPQSKISEQESTDEAGREQPFVRQVEDHSLPAQEVLIDQQECRAPDEAPTVFVP